MAQAQPSELINPATEEALGAVPNQETHEVSRLLDRAAAGFVSWRETGFADRARMLGKAGALMRQRSAALAAAMTREMGKAIKEAESEVAKCAGCCDYFAEHAGEMLKPQIVKSDAQLSEVRFDPLGPVLAIMPWNFPFWQVIRFAAPNLMAGNVGILKHAPNVPGCALALQGIFDDAGFPPGVWTTLFVENDEAEALIGDDRIAAVTLTGSTRAGIAVASAAAKVLKKSVLELGGSDPFVVLAEGATADDIRRFAKSAAGARCINVGQSCIAAKRFIVEAPIFQQFTREFVAAMAALKVGDPADRSTDLGPLARLDLLENLERQVAQSIGAGAKLLLGGKRLAGRGDHYPPTVLSAVAPGMIVFDEETFGPVAALVRAADREDAIRLANQTRNGLGASLWMHDPDKARLLAPRIDAGSVFINGSVKSDWRLPFGGIKQSGWGRELSQFGIREFVNIKTVWSA